MAAPVSPNYAEQKFSFKFIKSMMFVSYDFMNIKLTSLLRFSVQLENALAKPVKIYMGMGASGGCGGGGGGGGSRIFSSYLF